MVQVAPRPCQEAEDQEMICPQHHKAKAMGLPGMQLESQAAGEPIPGAEAAIRAKPKKATMKKLIRIIYLTFLSI